MLSLLLDWITLGILLVASVAATYFIRWGREFGDAFMASALHRGMGATRIFRDHHAEYGLRSEVFVLVGWAVFVRTGALAYLAVWMVLALAGADGFGAGRPFSWQAFLAKLSAFSIAGAAHVSILRSRYAGDPALAPLWSLTQEERARRAITGG